MPPRPLCSVLLTLFTLPLIAAEPATKPAAGVPAKKPVEPDARVLVTSILEPKDGSTNQINADALLALEARRGTGQAEALAALAWLDRNRQAVRDVIVPHLSATSWWDLQLTLRSGQREQPMILYLHAFTHHASGKLIAYGLSDKNLKRAYWLGEPKKDLKVESTGRDLVIEVTPKNGKPLDPVATVVALEFDGPPKPLSMKIRPEADGSVVLHSKQARVIGVNLRYEPEPHKNTLGYWSNPADWCRWEIVLSEKATYDVELLQGCGKGSGGSEVAIEISGSPANPKGAHSADSFKMIVEDTGHFQNFIPRVVGRTTIGPGTYYVAVNPISKKGVAVMDLRQVTLKPVSD